MGARLGETLWWRSSWSEWSFRWLLLCDFHFKNSPLWELHYYNCFFFWMQASLSVEIVEKKNGNLVKNLPTQWERLKKKTGRLLRISQPYKEVDNSWRIILLVKIILTQLGTEKENRTRDQSIKNLQNLIRKCGMKTKRS